MSMLQAVLIDIMPDGTELQIAGGSFNIGHLLVGSCVLYFGKEEELTDIAVYAEGQELDMVEFPLAYKVIGDTYGVDVVNGKFTLPDMSTEGINGGRWVIIVGGQLFNTENIPPPEDFIPLEERLYCGRIGIYCGMPDLYPNKRIIV